MYHTYVHISEVVFMFVWHLGHPKNDPTLITYLNNKIWTEIGSLGTLLSTEKKTTKNVIETYIWFSLLRKKLILNNYYRMEQQCWQRWCKKTCKSCNCNPNLQKTTLKIPVVQNVLTLITSDLGEQQWPVYFSSVVYRQTLHTSVSRNYTLSHCQCFHTFV